MQLFWKGVWKCLLMLNIHIIYDLALNSLWICTPKSASRMFVAGLFMIEPEVQQPKGTK